MDDLVKAIMGDPLENCQKEITRLENENEAFRSQVHLLECAISIMIDCMNKKSITDVFIELYSYRAMDPRYKPKGV